MFGKIKAAKSKFIETYRGQTFYDLIAGSYDFLNGGSWFLDRKAVLSRNKIRKLKNKYEGERCFIIGNGPSLREMDLSSLRSEFTFGLNRIYLLFDKLGFQTTFLVSVNDLVIEQSHQELNKINSQKFFAWKTRKFINFDRNTIFLRTLARQGFYKDVIKGVWEGTTVTYVALQIAYYLGFERVILIGVDHSFKAKGRVHKTVTSSGGDIDHFDPNYFGKGFRWNLPDLATSKYAYRLAKENFQEIGRVIVDATVGGKLKVFKKVRYEDQFK